ncbi:MAG: phosphonate ABC transporter ATP-binding protein [Robiginitomaculum sp.]|nr:MAG: phosphonate ABC transporter ATP-binding protein [Robiginitomaculum sp.]
MGKQTKNAPALHVQDTSVAFGDFIALHNADLVLEMGEMVALIGASGSGKSTLLRTIDGLQVASPGSGRIEVFGRKVQRDGRLAKGLHYRRRDIGMIFQSFNLVGRLSLFANVLIGALGRIPAWRGALGLYPAEDRKMAMDALERVGVAEFAGRRASKLSGGQKQRGAIARALVQGAQMILADEPIASLDPVSARKVMEQLQELNERDGITILVSLHQVDFAIRYCKRVVALKAGRIIYDGPADKMTKKDMIAVYGDEYEDAFWSAEAA